MGRYLTDIKQHPGELAEFVSFVKANNISSYLEIGCKFGGSLWAVAQAMPIGSIVVGVDLGRISEQEVSLRACMKQLKNQGYNAQLFLGDSTAAHTVKAVQNHAPYDLVFIDADHHEPFVRQDFANYGRLGKFCAFHDIGWNEAQNLKVPVNLRIDVPRIWKEIKDIYRDQATFLEIKLDQKPEQGWGHNGIGIIKWR